jgi:flavodoxin I
MKVLVIYDSVFGNTEKIAQAVSNALSVQCDVKLRRVSDVTPDDLTNLDLLIVGSPTRGFSPTPATKELITHLPKHSMQGVKVAAFDTRIAIEDVDSAILTSFVNVFGYAAKPIADRLRRRGGTLVMPCEGFFVEGKEGPLKSGELERAAYWARAVSGAAATQPSQAASVVRAAEKG